MGGPVWSWGVRARPGTAAALAVLSALAVATAVAGGLLSRAVDQSAVATAVAAAGPDTTAVAVSADVQPGDPIEGLEAAEQSSLLAVPTSLFRPPVTIVESVAPLAWTVVPGGSSTASAAVAARHSRIAVQDEDCAGVRLPVGRCPTAATEVALASGDASRLGLTVGSGVVVQVPVGDRISPVRLTVSGEYDPASPGLAVTSPTSLGASASGVTATDLLVGPRSRVWNGLTSTAITRRALRGSLRVEDIPVVRQALAGVQRDALSQTDLLIVDQRLASLLAGVDRESRDASTLIWVLELQALALALGVLAVVLQRFARARAREWGVGRLRGLKMRTWLTSVYAEPLVPLLVGLPVGYLLGVAAARITASLSLRGGTPIEPWRAPVLLSAVIVVAGSMVVLVGASVRSAAVDLAQLLGEVTEERRTSRLAAVGQSATVLLAAVSTYQLLAGSRLTESEGRLGLLEPALLAVAVVVVAVQVAGWRTRRTASVPAQRLWSLVVVRQLGRTPSTLLRSAMVTVGAALVVFTTQLAWASSLNQQLLADASAGADQVLTVQVPTGRDLRQIVDAADPSGRQAMAVEELAGAGDGGTSRIIAVDTTRLATVSTWRSTWSGLTAAQLRAALLPSATAPVEVRGNRLTLAVDVVSSVAGPLSLGVTSLPQPSLTVTVESQGSWRSIFLGPLPAASDELTAPIPCARGCRLVALVMTPSVDSPYDATLRIHSLSTDLMPSSAFDALLHGAGRWQPRVGPLIDPARPGFATPTPTPDGLVVKVHDATGDQQPAIEPTDGPDPLPALLGPSTQTSAFPGLSGAGRGTGLDGQAQLIRPVGHASVLPRGLGDGVVVDLVAAQRLSDPSRSEAMDEVWLTPGPHAAVEAALSHAGVRILGRARLATMRRTLSGQAPTRATTVTRVIVLLAAFLVVAGLAIARWLDAESRRRDWRGLRVAGLAGRRIRRLAVAEIAAPALCALLAGAVAGLVAYRLSVRRLPIRVGEAGPPLEVGPSWARVLLVVGAGVVVVMAMAAVSAWLEVRDRPGEGAAGD